MTPNPHNDRVKKWLRLHLTSHIGGITFARLLQAFGNIDAVLNATAGQLASVPRIGAKTARAIVAARDDVDVDKEIRNAEKLGIRIITRQCADYPPALAHIPDPPPVLYIMGNFVRQDQLALAIVGTRHCSNYGREQATRLSHFLAAAGFTIVSGLALGIDTWAHHGALTAKGRTIAVLGSGLAHIYPRDNHALAQRIVKNGALISEYPLDTQPKPGNFPARNRIIAGLSLGTMVVEARLRSGALITARLAMEQNREVLAVPGRIDAPNSAGPHQLIKDGAALVEKVEDVIAALSLNNADFQLHVSHAARRSEQALHQTSPSAPPNLILKPDEKSLLSLFDADPLHIDEILSRCDLPVGTVHEKLLHLGFKGLLKSLPGGYYQKI